MLLTSANFRSVSSPGSRESSLDALTLCRAEYQAACWESVWNAAIVSLWLQVKKRAGKKKQNMQIPNQMPHVQPLPIMVSNEEAKHVGCDFCYWPLIHHLHHLPFWNLLKLYLCLCWKNRFDFFLCVAEVWISAAGTVFCWAAARANYPSLFLPDKWGTQHASLAVQPVACFLVKISQERFSEHRMLKLELAKVLFPSVWEQQNRH